jgi:hypothetical protein
MLRRPAACFFAIILEEIGIMNNDTPVANAYPVRNTFNSLSMKFIPASIVGKVGAYVWETTRKIVNWIETIKSCGRAALIVFAKYSQKNRKAHAVTLAAALYSRVCLLPDEPVVVEAGARMMGWCAATAHRIESSAAAAAKHIVMHERIIDWMNFARGRIGSDKNDVIAIRYPNVEYVFAHRSLW